MYAYIYIYLYIYVYILHTTPYMQHPTSHILYPKRPTPYTAHAHLLLLLGPREPLLIALPPQVDLHVRHTF